MPNLTYPSVYLRLNVLAFGRIILEGYKIEQILNLGGIKKPRPTDEVFWTRSMTCG